MGRQYAGILGLLAFGAIVARSIVRGSGAESTLLAAVAGMFAWAAIGWIVGTLAERVVEESTRARIRAEIETQEAAAAAR